MIESKLIRVYILLLFNTPNGIKQEINIKTHENGKGIHTRKTVKI